MTKYWAMVCAVAALGCGSSSDSASIYGDWLRSVGGLVVGLTFEPDGTYSVKKMQVVSATAVNQQLETGTAVVESSSFSLTPSKWSCPEHSEPSFYAYSLDEDTLSVAGATYARNDAAPDAATVFTVGCFSDDGAFRAYPLLGDEP